MCMLKCTLTENNNGYGENSGHFMFSTELPNVCLFITIHNTPEPSDPGVSSLPERERERKRERERVNVCPRSWQNLVATCTYFPKTISKADCKGNNGPPKWLLTRARSPSQMFICIWLVRREPLLINLISKLLLTDHLVDAGSKTVCMMAR